MSYLTIAKETRIEYIIEKSRFIATASPCQTEEDAQNFISRINKEFWDANHNCTAFVLGERQEQQRSSDNGEPSGTAGKPILEVLKKTQITNTAIVVTRYFGGIKLGAGGLIRAYSHSAAEVLRQAPKLLYTPKQLVNVTVNYNHFNAIENYLKTKKIHYQKDFQEQVNLLLYLDINNLTEIQIQIQNLTNGQNTWHLDKIELVALPYP